VRKEQAPVRCKTLRSMGEGARDKKEGSAFGGSVKKIAKDHSILAGDQRAE